MKESLFMNKRGTATTEFIVVSMVFILLFAGFALIGETIVLKMKSLIMVRNLVFDQNDSVELAKVSHEKSVIPAGKTPDVMMDPCLWPYFAARQSRTRAEVKLEFATLFDAWISPVIISDHYQIAQESWKSLSSTALGLLAAGCPG